MSLGAGLSFAAPYLEHAANLGQLMQNSYWSRRGFEQAQHLHQEQVVWNRRAYCLDTRALRINILTAVKEDARDHHQTHAGMIETLLLVHTLILTFALATIQYSGHFMPSTSSGLENIHPSLVWTWAILVALVLILPFWSILMLILTKLRLDRWLKGVISKLTVESILGRGTQQDLGPLSNLGDAELMDEAEATVDCITFDYAQSFKRVWGTECDWMIWLSVQLLWLSCAIAILITGGMFWLYLVDNMESTHHHIGTLFMGVIAAGLSLPLLPAVVLRFYYNRKENPVVGDGTPQLAVAPSMSGPFSTGISHAAPQATASGGDVDCVASASPFIERRASPARLSEGLRGLCCRRRRVALGPEAHSRVQRFAQDGEDGAGVVVDSAPVRENGVGRRSAHRHSPPEDLV